MTMSENNIIVKNGKELRFGYTTGSCATAAAAAATEMLITGKAVALVVIELPSGSRVAFSIGDISIEKDSATCSVIKDAGDDPDVTDGMKIVATVCFCGESGIKIFGGKGIGVVTCKGLPCAVGEAAINPVPKSMMLKNVTLILEKHKVQSGIIVTISAPKGEEIAKKTFNARLGIVGGISILGTTGIVEPMSEKALIDTIKLLIDKQAILSNDKILVSPGNYGKDYCKNILHIDLESSLKCSNFIGETLDYLVYKGFGKLLLIGHVGKLVKIAGGIMNTHSSVADCRMEIISAHAALLGASQNVVLELMNCLTTTTAIEILERENLSIQVFESIIEKIKFHIDYRVKGQLQTEVIIFSEGNKMIGKSKDANSFVTLFMEGNL